MACNVRYDAKTGTYVKKCSKKKKRSGMFGDIADLGAGNGRVAKAKGFLTFAGISIPTLLYAGGLGAVGAVGAKYIWNVLLNPKDSAGKYRVIDTSKDTYIKAIAEMATGGGIGFVVMKLLKQPKLGAALMIGPIVVGIMDLIKPSLPKQVSDAMAGVPEIRLVHSRSHADAMTLPVGGSASRLPMNVRGITQVGPGIPNALRYRGQAAMASI